MLFRVSEIVVPVIYEGVGFVPFKSKIAGGGTALDANPNKEGGKL
jgi:hypothetical protein